MVNHQIKQFFGLSNLEENLLNDAIQPATKKCISCYPAIRNKYYQNTTLINPLHTAQYTQFLYFLSKEIALIGETELADKIYYLNKALNSCVLYHAIELPSIFTLDHPLGSVMGRASYSRYFSFQQGCTVGHNRGVFPTIGQHVKMLANSTIIGQSNIGNHVFLAANTYVKDENIPDQSIVFGQSPNLIIKSRDLTYFKSNSLFNLPEGLSS